MKRFIILEVDCPRCDSCKTQMDCENCFRKLLQGPEQDRFEHVDVQPLLPIDRLVVMRGLPRCA